MKALFFDIDGTLIDLRRGVADVPEPVVRELRRIQGLGHKLFICSGRPYSFIGEKFRSLGFDGYVLVNGGQVEYEGAIIYEELLDTDLARAMADLHEEAGCGYAIDTAHHVFIDPSFEDVLTFLGAHDDQITRAFDREHALRHAIKIESHPPVEARAFMTARIAADFADVVTCDDNGTDGTFEVYSPRLSKARGIHMVLEHLGIGAQDAYGFGDGINDLPMIRTCGCGVAMGNAVDEVKAAADIICGSVEDNGLAEVLAELF